MAAAVGIAGAGIGVHLAIAPASGEPLAAVALAALPLLVAAALIVLWARVLDRYVIELTWHDRERCVHVRTLTFIGTRTRQISMDDLEGTRHKERLERLGFLGGPWLQLYVADARTLYVDLEDVQAGVEDLDFLEFVLGGPLP